MKYEDIKKGKIYYREMAERKNRKRGQAAPVNVYKMLVVDKDDNKQEVIACCISERGQATAPQTFPVNSWRYWTTNKT